MQNLVDGGAAAVQCSGPPRLGGPRRADGPGEAAGAGRPPRPSHHVPRHAHEHADMQNVVHATQGMAIHHLSGPPRARYSSYCSINVYVPWLRSWLVLV
jgi:hypothetical protein